MKVRLIWSLEMSGHLCTTNFWVYVIPSAWVKQKIWILMSQFGYLLYWSHILSILFGHMECFLMILKEWFLCIGRRNGTKIDSARIRNHEKIYFFLLRWIFGSSYFLTHEILKKLPEPENSKLWKTCFSIPKNSPKFSECNCTHWTHSNRAIFLPYIVVRICPILQNILQCLNIFHWS